MTFKLKAWMIYVIGVATIPLIWVKLSDYYEFGTGRGFLYGHKMGASLLTTLVDKVLAEKIPKKTLDQLRQEFVKEFNKMSAFLNKP